MMLQRLKRYAGMKWPGTNEHGSGCTANGRADREYRATKKQKHAKLMRRSAKVECQNAQV